MARCIVNQLVLTHFRNFSFQEFSFDENVTWIVGNNGKGKTNTLESIGLLSTGKSFKSHLLSDCVQTGFDVAHIEANVSVEADAERIGVSIISANSELSKRASTRFKRNGTNKRRTDVMGLLKTIVFRPEDLEIVTQGPSYKREYLDTVLIQVSRSYAHSHKEYEKALKHRNKLILQLREGLVSRNEFTFWDTLLIKHGDVLTRQRERLIHFINTYVGFPVQGQIQYDHSLMTEERLHHYAVAEVAAGKTLVGPHRDSLEVRLDVGEGKVLDVGRFGSRGQQRLAVLWLKIAALQFIEQETGEVPVLLLDDIFSELDDTNRHLVTALFTGRQVIGTSAEPDANIPDVRARCLLHLS